MNKKYTLLLLLSVTHCTSMFSSEEKVQETEEAAPAERKITLTNAAQPADLAYKHWSGSHSPEKFNILVNDEPIATDTSKDITLENDSTSLEMSYKYSFAKGLYKGTDKVTVKVPAEGEDFAIKFSWLKEPRIWLEEQIKEQSEEEKDISHDSSI